MKKTISLILMAVFMAIAICGCSASEKSNFPANSDTETNQQQEQTGEKAQADDLLQTDSQTPQEVSFPYTDEEGRIRYKMVINGEEIETESFPFKLGKDEKGAYFPIKDIMKYFGIDVIESDDKTMLATKLNNKIIKVTADQAEMTFGNSTFVAYNGSVKPLLVDGVLYAPNFLFMQLSDNTIVDFSEDNTSATLTTDLIIDYDTSGTAGVTIVANSAGGSNSNSNETKQCPKCNGAGGYNESTIGWTTSPNGTQYATTVHTWKSCTTCGGSGYVHN